MTNSDLAANEIIRERYPILSQALLAGASQQLRNMATVGGNLMQRTRCPYFRDVTLPCNKREPGTGCPAIEGYSRMHAIFGGSDQCIAVMPSDMAVALLALEATIHIRSEQGERKVPISKFYLAPGEHPQKETVLEHGELIVHVELPPSKFAKYSHYLKVRDRSSFSFALVSVAACLDINNGQIGNARIALGGAAVHPWRLEKAEKVLIGKTPSAALFAAAAQAAVEGAKPTKYNKFKVELTKRSVERALQIAAGGVS
jgi:xanthine dehydrogenase YagS FAD-binding subunit